jgi:hypothetical protein
VFFPFTFDSLFFVCETLATKEVTEALLPGGSLNPPSKALNPLYCTFGGVAGPIAVYFILLHAFIAMGWISHDQQEELSRCVQITICLRYGLLTRTEKIVENRNQV